MKKIIIACLILAGLCPLSCALTEEPGSFSMSFEWDKPPEGEIYLWVRVEERADGATSGPILASAGPALFVYGEPFELTMDSVANGDDRVIVVEVREGESAGLPVLYYGLSDPFSLYPGMNVKVDVPMELQTPEADEMEASVELLFAGGDGDTVSPDDISNGTIRTRSFGAVGIVLANDASFTSNLRSLTLGDGESVTCTQEADGDATWDLCEIPSWDLLAGLPDLGDGLYSVYVKFADKNGYESQVYKDSVVLDSQAPTVLVAALTPEVAHSGETVVLSVTFHEALHTDPALALLTVSPQSETMPVFSGPLRVGDSTSYVWSADIPELDVEDEHIYTFEVDVLDSLGNQGEAQPLMDADGAPLEFGIDAVAPTVWDQYPIEFNESLFAIEGEGIHDEGIFEFNFLMAERSPHEVSAGEDGLCVGICPEVLPRPLHTTRRFSASRILRIRIRTSSFSTSCWWKLPLPSSIPPLGLA